MVFLIRDKVGRECVLVAKDKKQAEKKVKGFNKSETKERAKFGMPAVEYSLVRILG